MRKLGFAVALLLALALAPGLSHGQSTEAFAKALHIYDSYRVVPNITYLTANNWEAKLDVYQARDATTPNPTLIYFHGGGWTAGSKEASSLTFLPFLDMGWDVVKLGYPAGEDLIGSCRGSGRAVRATLGLPQRQRIQCGHRPAGAHGELGRRTSCAD